MPAAGGLALQMLYQTESLMDAVVAPPGSVRDFVWHPGWGSLQATGFALPIFNIGGFAGNPFFALRKDGSKPGSTETREPGNFNQLKERK